MAAMSFFDYVTLSLGWLINNGLWNLLASTGVVAIPFIFKFIGIVQKVREQGAYQGNQAPIIVSRMENYFYISLVIIFFTCYPSIEIDPKVLHYEMNGYSSVIDQGKIVRQEVTSCSYAEISPNSSKFQDVKTQLGGQSIYVPLWWYFVHAMSSGLAQAAVTQLPCNTDLREVHSTISKLAVDDPVLMDEANQFYEYCFNPSFNKLRTESKEISSDMMDDVTWPGSSYFQTTSGYYDTFRAKLPQKDWPYDEKRDVGLTPGQNSTGYPVCNEWWNNESVGLHTKIIENINKQKKRAEVSSTYKKNLNPNINEFGIIDHFALSKAEKEEFILRSVLTPKKFLGNANYMYIDYTGNSLSQQAGNTLASAGIIYKSLTSAIEFDALRKAAPMIQSVLLMCIIILLPVIITLGAFEPKVVITLTFVIFTIIFLTFVWELARFLDSKLIEIMYGNEIVKFMNSKFSTDNKSIVDLITSMVFIGFPILLLAGMGWTGVKIGSQIEGVMNSQSKTMQQAGSEGIDMVESGVKKAGSSATKMTKLK